MGLNLKVFSANYKLCATNYKVNGASHDGKNHRATASTDRYWPPDRKCLYMLGRACHVQAPTDSPYIGRVTVMVVPSFSLLLKAMVP